MLQEADMGNVKHTKTQIRELAAKAKARLLNKPSMDAMPPFPKTATPEQREIFIKLYKMKKGGENVDNPISVLADPKKMTELSGEEKQRYIIQLAADYTAMKRLIDDDKLA